MDRYGLDYILLKDFKSPQKMVGDDFLRELKKAIVERAMKAELTAQLRYEKSEAGEKETTNRRNGHGSKQVRTDDHSQAPKRV